MLNMWQGFIELEWWHLALFVYAVCAIALLVRFLELISDIVEAGDGSSAHAHHHSPARSMLFGAAVVAVICTISAAWPAVLAFSWWRHRTT